MSGEKQASLARTVLLILVACLITSLTVGISNNYGIMLAAIIDNTGLGYASVSFVIAVGQMFYGMVQPAFGLLAESRGNRVALFAGVLLMLAGLLLLPWCTQAWQLLIAMGLFLPAGTGAISYGLLMSCITPKLPARTVSIAAGIVNASSGVGSAAVLPLTQHLINNGGLAAAMFGLAVPTVLLVPLCFWIGRREAGKTVEPGGETGFADATRSQASPGMKASAAQCSNRNSPDPNSLAAGFLAKFSDAFHSRTYRHLMVVFFICGFHMTLIYGHLPSQFVSYGIDAETSALAFSLYGIVTIVGSVASGWLCSRLEMKCVLGTLFAMRSVIVLAFLLLPKTVLAVFVFSAFLGLTGASTVPPVSGIINERFGAARLASLFGFVYFVHQLGAFFGAWLGGVTFELIGSYNTIWVVDIILCAIAAMAAFLIKKQNGECIPA